MVARLAEEVINLDNRNRRHRDDDRGAISPTPPRRNHPEHARLRRYLAAARIPRTVRCRFEPADSTSKDKRPNRKRKRLGGTIVRP
jgi:hypothetical protein